MTLLCPGMSLQEISVAQGSPAWRQSFRAVVHPLARLAGRLLASFRLQAVEQALQLLFAQVDFVL